MKFWKMQIWEKNMICTERKVSMGLTNNRIIIPGIIIMTTLAFMTMILKLWR